MKEPFSEEILSAYIDGELPPRERAEVEQWLGESPAARQKLEDFRRLSMLFANLPRTEIPQEFPTKVLQLAERRMLLPETVAISARRRFHRRILAVGGAIASAAAVLFVIVHFRDPGLPPGGVAREGDPILQGRPHQDSPVHNRQRDIDPGDGELYAGKDRATGTPALDAPAAPPADDRPDSGSALPGTVAPPARSDAINPLVAAGGPLKKAPAKMAPSRSAKESGSPAEIARKNQQLSEFNRMVDRLGGAEADDEHLSVVTIHIDHAEGLTLVQKILVNNSVLPPATRETQEQADEKVALKSRAVAGAPADDLKECLIVIAEPEKVIAALTEILEREDAAIRLTVEAPLEIAFLDAESQKLLKLAEVEGGLEGRTMQRRRDAAAPVARSADKAEERGGKGRGGGDATPRVDAAKSDGDAGADTAPRATSEKKKAADSKDGESGKSDPSSLRSQPPDADNGRAKRKEATASPGSDRATAGQARQFVVPVPKELENRQLTAAAETPQPSRKSASLEKLTSPAPKAAKQVPTDGKPPLEREQTRRPPSLVRVLFVIEPGTARPAAPVPSSKGPSGGAS